MTKLPNYEQVVIPEAKIVDYLLSLTHPDGSSKAVFFMRFGFMLERWETLVVALQQHAADYEVVTYSPHLKAGASNFKQDGVSFYGRD